MPKSGNFSPANTGSLSPAATNINEKDSVAPENVTNLSITPKDGRVLLTWTDANDDDVFGYEVSYSGMSAINRSVITAIPKNSMIVPKDSGGCYVSGLTNGMEYTFTVKTMDTSENRSPGVSIRGTPTSAMNNGDVMNIILSSVEIATNTSLTVNTTIISGDSLKKVVYKKNGSINAKKLLSDSNAIDITNDIKSTGKFSISANSEEQGNGTYTIAAIDEAGREETEQITVTQFDFTPPALVNTVLIGYSSIDNTVTINWNSPTTSDFDHVDITYIFNNGSSDSQESLPISAIGTDSIIFTVKSGIESSAKSYKYLLRTVDELGNTSEAVPKSIAVEEGVSVGYQFHETVEYLPVGTDGSAGTTGTYVLFGDWPQTIKAENVEIDSGKTMTKGGFIYYWGTDENWYVQCRENAFSTDIIYSDGTSVSRWSDNSIKYFKVEPIKWRVLNPTHSGNEKTILFCENIIQGGILYYEGGLRTLNNTTIYPNNYKYSNIRAYLNGIKNQFVTDGGISDSYTTDWSEKGFLQTAFTSLGIQNIADTIVKNDINTTRNDTNELFLCDTTIDKVFLLNYRDSTDSNYSFSNNTSVQDSKRIRAVTDYSKANYTTGVYYYLRSPMGTTTTGSSFWVWCVSSLGIVREIMSHYSNCSFVPALTISE